MAYRKIELNRREVILLSGFNSHASVGGKEAPIFVIDRRELEAVAAAHNDAVAFGYVQGKWLPAA